MNSGIVDPGEHRKVMDKDEFTEDMEPYWSCGAYGADRENERWQRKMNLKVLRKEAIKARRYLTIRGELRTLEISLWVYQINKWRKQEQALLEKMMEMYELDYQSAQAVCVPIKATANVKRRIRKIKNEIANMGNVYVSAIEEYNALFAEDSSRPKE